MRIADELVELVRDLVKLDSVNPYGNEKVVTEYLLKLFDNEGVEHWTIDVENDRKNIIAILRGEEDGEGIIFTGHQDVVPISEVERKKWTKDPFSAEVENDFVYGRGSSDMKGGLAAAILAFLTLKRNNIRPKKDIILVITCDEEHYMKGSQKALLDDAVKSAKYCVVCEPTNLKICNASRGRTWAEVNVYGKTAHGSQKGIGVNAIEKCSKLIEKIVQHKFVYDKLYDVGESFWQPYAIHAGIEPAIVPDKCTMFVDARLALNHFPDQVWQDLEEIFKEIQLNDSDFKASYNVVEKRSPWITDKNNFIVQQAINAMEKNNLKTEFDIFMGTTDGTKFNSIGISPIIFGPGDLSVVHKENECLFIPQLIDAYEIYYSMMVNF